MTWPLGEKVTVCVSDPLQLPRESPIENVNCGYANVRVSEYPNSSQVILTRSPGSSFPSPFASLQL